MSNLLVVTSSLSGDASVSDLLVQAAARRLLREDPGLHVVRRDLSDGSIPHLIPATVTGVRGTAVTPAEIGARALADELLAEVLAADVIVIGAPMYNFSIPTTLRAWFDHLLRPGVTFSYSEAGPKGLVIGKRVIVVESRGGLYSEGPAAINDFQEPYLRLLLGFIGITDVSFIHAEKIGFGPEAREGAIAGATAEIDRLVESVCALAA